MLALNQINKGGETFGKEPGFTGGRCQITDLNLAYLGISIFLFARAMDNAESANQLIGIFFEDQQHLAKDERTADQAQLHAERIR